MIRLRDINSSFRIRNNISGRFGWAAVGTDCQLPPEVPTQKRMHYQQKSRPGITHRDCPGQDQLPFRFERFTAAYGGEIPCGSMGA
jgi:hypothetical protein